ncbi:GNAT family N-acetyltransferase [Tianweitania sp. BSSL-BM11]|uniref:GNAT family N-acetyltransferase n=1 Tax=Tianweitania aestuarii TaxID=2814886 RepID=A0ABS5RX50_9HYPH|nr:GNAT family N-acetyltransferase [Tianweitania aestuarii]MBS9721601.1 GNAT family N-acetyltransferase [Tianweitania aestuarii]
MPEQIRIDDLRDRPERIDDVADRLWTAWWRDGGVSLEELTGLVRESLGPSIVPSTFVAHRDGQFAGTASLIAHDMDARPHYSPWVAAVWVEADHRGSGIGSQLVRHISALAFAAGIARLYLYCEPSKGPFYAALGWRQIEADVDGNDIFVLDA